MKETKKKRNEELIVNIILCQTFIRFDPTYLMCLAERERERLKILQMNQ